MEFFCSVYLLEVFALFSKGSTQSSSSPSDSGESVPSWDVHKEEHEENSHQILETLLAPHVAHEILETLLAPHMADVERSRLTHRIHGAGIFAYIDPINLSQM